MIFRFKSLLFKNSPKFGYIIEENTSTDDPTKEYKEKKSIVVIIDEKVPIFYHLYNKWNDSVKKKIKAIGGDYEREDIDPSEAYSVIDKFYNEVVEGDNKTNVSEVDLDTINGILAMVSLYYNVERPEN